MPNKLIQLTREEMQLPDFHFKEVESLYFNDLTLPTELYNDLLQKERGPLIEDLDKLLTHAVEHFNIFSEPGIDSKNTYAPWHALFLLKDLEATEALPSVLAFLQQDEDCVHFYLGDGIEEFGWELLYALGKDYPNSLVEFVMNLKDDYDLRKAAVDTLKQIALHHPERQMEIQSHLHTLVLFTTTVQLGEDIYIDDVANYLIDTIGELQLTSLYPELNQLYDEDRFPSMLVMKWESFEKRYVSPGQKANPEPAAFRTREEIYAECMINFAAGEDDDDDDDYEWEDVEDSGDDLADDRDDDVFDYLVARWKAERGEDSSRDYTDYDEVQTPYVKQGPDIGRNDPCPCGSGKKYKKCCGKG